MQKTWKIREPDVALKDALAAELGVSGLLAQLLISRGISDKAGAEVFLRSGPEDLFDPFLMQGMPEAVKRVKEAVKKKENIFIATDFDVDGVTSCAILEEVLARGLGACVSHYLPHRVKDGYGLNAEAVLLAKAGKAGLFIALDCGITAFEEISALKKSGIEVIVIDHHEPPCDGLPEASAILNPKQKSCPYPFKDLTTAGLVYKFIQALGVKDAADYLDLAALGTVADVAPLTGENRILVKNGLDVLSNTRRHGLCSLKDASGLKEKKVSTRAISFILAPRLNASGRIDSAYVSLDLLLSNDPQESGLLARSLNEHNRTRQRVEEDVFKEAVGLIDRQINFKDDFVIVLAKEGWHPGVLGIVAAKVAERFGRPAIIISLKDGEGRGSARSVYNFHIHEALGQCRRYLGEYGGHKYAAGISLSHLHIEDFRMSLNRIARDYFQKEWTAPQLVVDAQIPLSLVNAELLAGIDTLGPFGEGNSRPVFVSRGLRLKSRPMVVGKNSLKLWVTDGERTYEAIGFGRGDDLGLVSAAGGIDLAYCLGWDDYKQDNSIQLEIKDIRPSL